MVGKSSLTVSAAALLATLSACKTNTGGQVGSSTLANDRTGGMWQHPWELASNKGEMYLGDVFYADPVQNEQVMPTDLLLQDGDIKRPAPCRKACYHIDRLIYPTIGNPNLYTRDDATDEFTIVLRLEEGLYSGWLEATDDRLDTYTARANFKGDGPDGLKIYLIARNDRRDTTQRDVPVQLSGGVFEIKPSSAGVRDQVGLADLDRRRTVRLDFNQGALAAVPAGLYDIRVELLKGGNFDSGPNQDFAGFEFQFNALRIFDQGPGDNNYNVVNVTDSQVSISDRFQNITDALGHKKSFKSISHDKLQAFVSFINQAIDTKNQPEIANAAFISFNGDLHNGGSPASLTPAWVAWTYVYEARAIVNILKTLKMPIFLTTGNHDGYASMGHTPNVPAFKAGPESLQAVVEGANPQAWPAFSSYLAETADQEGGRHVDIFSGHYVQRGKAMPKAMAEAAADPAVTPYEKMSEVWTPVDPAQANMVLYDGFNQWRRTYGPLFSSWTFGKNHYVNVNSYDMRQHRRTGWGMYTVNYGGNVSQFQMDWIKKELQVHADKDVLILAHHDPRGGHNGKDHPFMFGQIEFNGMEESFTNYVQGEEINPRLCKALPQWVMGPVLNMSCLHDGLQEWMMADNEFDCERQLYDATTGRCNYPQDRTDVHPRYSAFQFLHWITVTPNVRTMLLGHTHYNSMEIHQAGEELVPKSMEVDQQTLEKLAAIESADPVRAAAEGDKATGWIAKLKSLVVAEVAERGKKNTKALDLAARGHKFQNVIQGENRELAILRMTSIADQTSQQYTRRAVTGAPGVFSDGISNETKTAMGFAVFGMNHGTQEEGRAGYPMTQLNEVIYYIAADDGSYARRLAVGVPRTKSFNPGEEGDPLTGHFKMKK